MNTPLTEEVFKGHEKYLWQLANKYARKFVFLAREDIFQELCVASIIAWQKYDPDTYGTKFITYLTPRCWMAIAHMAEGQHSIVRQNQTDKQRKAFWQGDFRYDRAVSTQNTFLTPDIDIDGKDDWTWEKGCQRYTQLEDPCLLADECITRAEECAFVHQVFASMNLDNKDRWLMTNRLLADEPVRLRYFASEFGQSVEAGSQREKKLVARFINEARRALGMSYEEKWVDWQDRKGGRPAGAKNRKKRLTEIN